MPPLSKLWSLFVTLVNFLAISVAAGPLASSSLSPASPSATSTAHPFTIDPALLSIPGSAFPHEALVNDINLWYHGDYARLYIGSMCFSVDDEKKRQVKEVDTVPETGEGTMKKIGKIVFPSADAKIQILAILKTCGFQQGNPRTAKNARGHYFQSLVRTLVKTSKQNDIPVMVENGGDNDVESVLVSLLQENKFLGSRTRNQGKHGCHNPY